MHQGKGSTSPSGVDYKAVLADLHQRRDELDTAISTLERIAAKHHLQVAAPDELGETLAEAAANVLKASGRALSTRDITKALTDAGYPSEAKNFYHTVYTTLKRNDGELFEQDPDSKLWSLR